MIEKSLKSKRVAPPFELLVIRICEWLHVTPSQVLEQDLDWIWLLLKVRGFDNTQAWKESKRFEQKMKLHRK